MNFKLLVVMVCMTIGLLAIGRAMADYTDGESCADQAQSHCNYCCVTTNGYTGSKWKKYGGSSTKICVCTGPSGSQPLYKRYDYDPGPPTPYQPSDPRYYSYSYE